MTFVWIVVTAFLLGWGTNLGALSVDRLGTKDRWIFSAAQLVIMVLALVVFHYGA